MLYTNMQIHWDTGVLTVQLLLHLGQKARQDLQTPMELLPPKLTSRMVAVGMF